MNYNRLRELSHEILSSITAAPNLIAVAELTPDDFPEGQLRETFKAIDAEWQDSGSGVIDPRRLANKLGPNVNLAFFGSLFDGAIVINSEVFLDLVTELRRKAGGLRIAEKIERQAKSPAGIDEAEIRKDYEELDRTNNSTHGASLHALSEVKPEAVSFLWPGRILFGMLNLLAGSPGQGKSVLALTVAAILSKGAPLPDSGGAALECDSLFLCAEDPIAQAIRPRAEANGADLSRIFFIEAEELDAGEINGRLRVVLAANPRIRFVVIDPLNAFLKSGTDYFRDPDVRRSLLRPLASLAEETGAAVLGICHLNKRTDESGALNRIGGSVAYGAAARSVLALGHDPDNTERRFLAPAKCNYARMPGTIAFRIGEGARIEFEPNVIDIGADEVLQRQAPDQAAEGDYAASWLVEQLRAGPLDLKELFQNAKKESIGRTTLFRARKKIGVISRVTGFGQFKNSTWELPK